MPIDVVDVRAALHRLYIVHDDGALRKEDEKKAREIAALLDDVARASKRKGPFTLVDAAAGKAYVGVLAAHLLDRPMRVVVIERDPARAEISRHAAHRAHGGRTDVVVEVHAADVGDPSVWPQAADLVVALHACGAATDAVIDRAVAAEAKRIHLVPCCYGAAIKKEAPKTSPIPGQEAAERWAHALGIPRHGLVSRRFSMALTDAERTLRLEEAGYDVEVAELVPPTVTPFHQVWRARRAPDGVRARIASEKRALLTSASPNGGSRGY